MGFEVMASDRESLCRTINGIAEHFEWVNVSEHVAEVDKVEVKQTCSRRLEEDMVAADFGRPLCGLEAGIEGAFVSSIHL